MQGKDSNRLFVQKEDTTHSCKAISEVCSSETFHHGTVKIPTHRAEISVEVLFGRLF